MPLAEIALGAGIISGLFQGITGNAAARRREQQAQQAWVQGEMQKAINNGQQLFNASYAEMQQRERNAAIQRAAYLFESDSLRSLSLQKAFADGEMSKTYRQMKGALGNQLAASKISGGTSRALSLAQSTNFLKQTMQSDRNYQQAEKNIKRQMENMMAQQRFDLIMPNMQLASQKPIGESYGAMNILAGGIAGTASGLSAYATIGPTSTPATQAQPTGIPAYLLP